jgi:4-amino-4-deoxy-L-arabinose transferase-like glycosyltransferase
LGRVDFKKSAIELSPLFMILIGAALVAFSLGPYQNWDSQLEFEAASNVAKMGIPYVESFGTVIDQPPLGFYVEALFFRIFGLSVNTGVTLVSLFGLGSTVLVYLIGKELYGRSTGFFAAALLGLNSWHIVLSRSFLIDAQCLFFSLLCLYVGVLAIRKVSVKLTLASGLAFAAAMLTKFYAVFILVPLLLFYIYSRPKNLKRILSQLAAFSTPVLAFALTWYQLFLGHSLLSIFHHNDFRDVIPASVGIVASPFFATNFLMDYGLGLAFIMATAFSLLLVFSLRKYFAKMAIVDVISLASIIFVVSVNVVLGAVLNLNVPYFSAVKYLYQALPFFVLLTASLGAKSLALFRAAKSTLRLRKLLVYSVAMAALVLLAASLLSSMYYTNALSSRDYLQFRVERDVNYGYALLKLAPTVNSSLLMTLQYWGFAMVLFGLLWACRYRFTRLIKSVIMRKRK